MWQSVSFKECSDAFFEYKFDTDIFMIRCELYSPNLTGGRVCVHSDDSACELGSLKFDRGFLVMEKTYPVSFLGSNGIEKDSLTRFSIETSDGKVISSYPLGSHRTTLDSAQKLLDDMKLPSSESDAKELSQKIKENIKKLKMQKLPFLEEFEWHRVEDANEAFSLSAIRHITSSRRFLQSFEKVNCWHIGFKDDDDIFSVCIKSDAHLPNPMDNVLDCCTSFETDDGKYYVAGIGLFEDGQYFVRL